MQAKIAVSLGNFSASWLPKDSPTPEITAIERVPPEPTYMLRTEGNLPCFVSPPETDFSA